MAAAGFFRRDGQPCAGGMKRVVNDPAGTGYAARREDVLLAGKTGTAEIKASREDTTGTELGWFAVFTRRKRGERPILLLSMAEDVKKKEEAAAMLWKRTKGFGNVVWRQLVCSAGGDFCGRQAAGNEDEKGRGRSGRGGKGLRWKKFAWTCTKKRKKRGAQTNWKPLGAIVQSFGAYGYPAVDSKNQVDMEKAEQLLQFCRAVDRKQEAEITVFEVDYRGGLCEI